MIYCLRPGPDSATSQSFWGCDETSTGGVLGVVVDGISYTGDTLAAADGYTGLVTVTSLEAGAHTYQMTFDGELVDTEQTFTLYEAGESFRLLFLGDSNQSVDACFQPIVDNETDVAAVFGAELYYIDNHTYHEIAQIANHDATASYPTEYASALSDIRACYLGYYANETSRLAMGKKWTKLNIPGNHDLLAGDAAHRPGTVAYDAAYKVMREFPSNGMPEASGDVDSTPVPVMYYNYVIGDVEVIMTDGLTYSRTHGANVLLGSTTDGGGTTGVGEDKQVDWMKAVVTASTANVLIFFPTTYVWKADWTAFLSWMTTNHPDKTCIVIVPNVHHTFAMTENALSDGMPTYGCSPSSAVTSMTAMYPRTGDAYRFSDYNQGVTLTAPTAADSAVITVTDTGSFDASNGLSIGDTSETERAIASIDSATQITLDAVVGSVIASGQAVRPINTVRYTDVDNDTVIARNLAYVRVIRHPNGSRFDPNPNTEICIVHPITQRVRHREWVRDGERTARTYMGGKASAGGL